MPTRDSLNHCLVIVIVGAAWLLDKIQAELAVPVLLALAGLITIPASLAAKAGSKSFEGPPPGTLLVPLTIGFIPMVTRLTQLLSLLVVLVGISACGASAGDLIARLNSGVAAMQHAYSAACSGEQASSKVCQDWAKALNALGAAVPHAGGSASDDDAGPAK